MKILQAPFIIRLFILVFYIDLVRRGLIFFYKYTFLSQINFLLSIYHHNFFKTTTKCDSIAFYEASYHSLPFSIIYTIDTLASLFGWISMYKHNLRSIYEHHIPGALFSFLCCLWHFNFGKEIENGFQKPYYYSVILQSFTAVIFIGQIAESFWVARTFMKFPDNWYICVLQRIIGLYFVSLMSICATLTAFCFLINSYNNNYTIIECVGFPLLLWFGLYLQPLYVKKHYYKLKYFLQIKKK